MELKLRHNIPYIIILALFGIASNFYMKTPITIMSTFLSICSDYVFLLVFQAFNKPMEYFTIKGAFKKHLPLIVLLSSGGALSHYFIFHNFTLLIPCMYVMLTSIILIIMERSSYE